MRTKTDNLLAIMNVLTWLTIAGLFVKAGAIIISYLVSIGNDEGSKNLYMGLNWWNLKQYDFWQYTGSVILILAIIFLEAYIAYLLTRVLSKIKMKNPFTMDVAKSLERMSLILLFTWAVTMMYNAHMIWLAKRIPGLQEHQFSGDFIFFAGIVFVIAQIFKKGVEIQTENELTV